MLRALDAGFATAYLLLLVSGIHNSHKAEGFTYLSSILGELKVNLWDHIRTIVPQKG